MTIKVEQLNDTTIPWYLLKNRRADVFIDFEANKNYTEEHARLHTIEPNVICSLVPQNMRHAPLFDIDILAEEFNIAGFELICNAWAARYDLDKGFQIKWDRYSYYYCKSQSGNVHAYINIFVPWCAFEQLLHCLVKEEFVDPIWAGLVIKRGYACLRYPEFCNDFYN